jgi:predicted transcriptional regulator
MQRTTVKLPDELDARLRHEAERRGTTIAEVIREALDRYLGPQAQRRTAGGRVWRSGRHDVSERIEQLLAEELGR